MRYLSHFQISILTATRAVTRMFGHYVGNILISILTATRAVTTGNGADWRIYVDFNPHRHKGGDLYGTSFSATCPAFQSSPPQGRWLNTNAEIIDTVLFQSSPPQGRWLGYKQSVFDGFWFQSSPPQGRWPKTSNISFLVTRFQSSPPQGRWLSQILKAERLT